MSPYRDQVTAAVRAVRIRSPAGYSWLGHRRRPLRASLLAQMDRSERRRHLAACISEELYASFYCPGGPVPARWGKAAPLAADPWLTTALSDANTGHGSWEPGWIFHSLDGDQAVVATPRLRVRVPAADCNVGEGGSIAPGVAVSVRMPKELPALSPGFFMVLSEAVFDASSPAGIVRAYWHVTPTGAPALVRALTLRLNAKNAPFRLKLADHPARFDRCDPAVLYLPADAFRPLRATLRQVATSLTASLHPRIPSFTLALAPGVGLAESPGTGQSFGLSRCELLADGIVSADEEAIKQDAARVARVIASLAANGVQIDAPYLEPSLDGRHVL
jgi:hypothetical protein